VRDQIRNPASLLNYYKRLIRIRRSTPALVEGEYAPLAATSGDYFAFLRSTDRQGILVILHYSDRWQKINLEIQGYKVARFLFSSLERSRTEEFLSNLTLGPFEALIAELHP
jgi:glycosidase